MPTKYEYMAIIPICFLAFLYLCKDILLFNRLDITGICNIKFTPTQLKVAFLVYPIWIFLVWIENLAQKREDYLILTVINIVTTYVGWWSTVAIFNDKFTSSKQQKAGLIFVLLLRALWRVTNILIFQ
jgi:hypothetical protein